MKNLKFTKYFGLFTILLICVIIIFIYWYKQTHSIATSNTYKVNTPVLDQKLLIATQASPFKDSLTTLILNRYKLVLENIEVIDVTALASIDAVDFDVILVIHRWEARAPCRAVQLFMEENLQWKNKIVMFTTSWNGLEKMENIDAITGASVLEDVPIITNKIIKRLDALLKL